MSQYKVIINKNIHNENIDTKDINNDNIRNKNIYCKNRNNILNGLFFLYYIKELRL